MAFFSGAPKSLSLALMLALAAACGSEDDPAPEGDGTDEEVLDEENDETGSGGGRLDGGAKIDASRPPAAKPDASEPAAKPDASTPAARPDASTPANNDSGAPKSDAGADAGGGLPGLPDLGELFPTNPPAPDAGSTPPTTGAGVCDDKTPHGCFTPAPGNPAGCPAQSPEIPLGYPSIDTWDFCNGGKVSAGGSCTWNGPNGGSALCLCDAGAHWLCIYS
jgi:hypothetical protein